MKRRLFDLSKPGALEQMLAAHRARYGDTQMTAQPGEGGDGGQGGSGSGDSGGQGGAEGGGGSGGQSGEGSGAGGGEGGQQGSQSGQQGEPGRQGGESGDGKTDAQKVDELPEWAQRHIRELRGESAERRTQLTAAEEQQREMVKAFAKAAGIELPGNDEQPDPAQLTSQLTDAQRAARQSQLELALYKTAPAANGDPNKLLDSRSFMSAVENIDPSDTAAIKSAVETAVQQNASLKAQAVRGASSADHAGGTGGDNGPRPSLSLEEASARQMG